MSHQDFKYSPQTDFRLVVSICGIVLLYLAAAATGWPQRQIDRHTTEQSAAAETAHTPETHSREKPNPPAVWSVIPFVLLLGAIALFPLLRVTQH